MISDVPRLARGSRGVRWRLASVTALVWLVAACGGQAPTPVPGTPGRSASDLPSPSVAPSVALDPAATRVAGWTNDLASLLPAMAAIHPDLFHGTSKAALEAAVEALQATVPTATDDELMVGVARIAATVSAQGRDGHTGLFVWGTGSYPVSSLPLRLWSFSDGLFIVDALPPYEPLIGGRIGSIAGRPISEVLAAIEPIVPRDNPATVTLVTPRYLLIPEVLHGLGLLDAAGPVELDLVDGTGSQATVSVEPVSMADYNAWAGPYGLHLPSRAGTLALSRADERLWSTVLDDSDALYVQYNRVELPTLDGIKTVKAAMARPDVQRVVLDLRQNYGGELDADRPLRDVLIQYGQAHPGRLFVLTGRNTFSAASLMVNALVDGSGARVVGEPMAGATAFWGDDRTVALPYSKLAVLVADSTYNDPSTATDPLILEPSIAAPMASTDYFADRDPALEAALGAP